MKPKLCPYCKLRPLKPIKEGSNTFTRTCRAKVCIKEAAHRNAAKVNVVFNNPYKYKSYGVMTSFGQMI